MLGESLVEKRKEMIVMHYSVKWLPFFAPILNNQLTTLLQLYDKHLTIQQQG